MNRPDFDCPVCNQHFETFAELHSHQQEFHNPQEDELVSMESMGGPFPCPECGIELTAPEEVEEHLVEAHPERGGMGNAPIQEGRGSKGTF